MSDVTQGPGAFDFWSNDNEERDNRMPPPIPDDPMCPPPGSRCPVTKTFIEDAIRESPTIKIMKREVDDMHRFIHGDDADYSGTSLKGEVAHIRSDMRDVTNRMRTVTRALYSIAVAVTIAAVLTFLGLK